MAKHAFEGRCHCGNVEYTFDASAALEVLGLRACQCSFCRAHGARTISDPNGTVQLRVADETKLTRYRFGLKTADFLLCTQCGVYLGALMSEAGHSWMTINANTLAPPPPLDAPVTPMDFSSEDAARRINRRKAKWTPVGEL
jgi:hypothetical protein